MLYLFEIMELSFQKRCGLRERDSECINIQLTRILCGMFVLIIVIRTIIFILITTITSNKG